MPYPEQTIGGEPGSYEHIAGGAAQTIPAVTTYCKRPKYAVFEMLKSMMPGRFIRLARPARSMVEGIAVRDDTQKRVMAMLVNRGDKPQEVTVTFSNLPFAGNSLIRTIRQIDATHSADCKGLEKGERGRLEATQKSATVTLQLPEFSIAQATLTPQ